MNRSVGGSKEGDGDVKEAGFLDTLAVVVLSFKILSDAAQVVSDNVDLTEPLYVANVPSDAQIQQFVETAFTNDDLLREGVLVAPMVFARKNLLGSIVGHAVLLRVEGVGASPDSAVLSSRFMSRDDKVVALDDVFQEHFKDEIEILSDSSYERMPNRERGIFLKLNSNGKFSGRKDYRDIPVQVLREKADRQAQFLNGLASVKEKELTRELGNRVSYYDKVIEAVSERLVVDGIMEEVSRAQRLHDESRKLLIAAQKEFETASRWGRAVAITQWIGMGLQAASILRAEYVQKEAKKQMSEAFGRIESSIKAVDAKVEGYNKSLAELNAKIGEVADQVRPFGALGQVINNGEVYRYYLEFGIEGIQQNGTQFDVKYRNETIIP